MGSHTAVLLLGRGAEVTTVYMLWPMGVDTARIPTRHVVIEFRMRSSPRHGTGELESSKASRECGWKPSSWEPLAVWLGFGTWPYNTAEKLFRQSHLIQASRHTALAFDSCPCGSSGSSCHTPRWNQLEGNKGCMPEVFRGMVWKKGAQGRWLVDWAIMKKICDWVLYLLWCRSGKYWSLYLATGWILAVKAKGRIPLCWI